MLSLTIWKIKWLLITFIFFRKDEVSCSLVGTAPHWLEEPPSSVVLLSREGGSLSCKAAGTPSPSVVWVDREQKTVGPIPGVREVLHNGTLILLGSSRSSSIAMATVTQGSPFHCRASNPLGTLRSRDVTVKLAPSEPWDVQVYDVHIQSGNTAVMSCVVPLSVRNYVTITSWSHGHLSYYPSRDAGARIRMLDSGELIIKSVDRSDADSSFKCRAVHTLTGTTRESIRPARIHITDSSRHSRPRINKFQDKVSVQKGSTATLLCPAYANPPPDIVWHRLSADGRDVPVSEPLYGSRDNAIQAQGIVLTISPVHEGHSETYTCVANNSVGTTKSSIQLQVVSQLMVQVIPPAMQVDAGGRATLTCVVNGFPVESVSWLHNGTPVPRRRGAEESKRRLALENVRSQDTGVYQCEVRGGAEESVLASSLITLGDSAPVFQYRFIEQTMQPGRSVSLKCIASGTPTPSLTWSLDGFPMPHSDRLVRGQYVGRDGEVISHVNISHAEVEDGGLYACTATNTASSTTHSARLNIYGLPIVRNMGEVTAVAGEQLVLTCPVGGYPIHSITWNKESTPLPLTHRQEVHTNGSLVIRNVQSASDEGLYSCTASDRSGHTSTQSVNVRVLVPPRLLPFHPTHHLREGTRLTLTCVVSEGDLPISFHWSKDGSNIGHDVEVNNLGDFNSYLRISNIQKNHAGNYTCKAQNAASSSKLTASVMVNVPPRVAPFFFRSNSEAGIRIQVSCSLEDGDLPVTIRWLKNGYPLGIENNVNHVIDIRQLDEYSSILVIPELLPEHSGNYSCEISNAARTGIFTAPLTVSVPPSWEFEPQDLVAVEGQDLFVSCSAKGFPQPKLNWRKETGTDPRNRFNSIISRHNSVHQFPNGTLLLKDISKSSEGRYSCEATNGIGAGLNKVIEIKINAPPRITSTEKFVKTSMGSEAVLDCPVTGDEPITVTWYKGGQLLSTDKPFKYLISGRNTNINSLSAYHSFNQRENEFISNDWGSTVYQKDAPYTQVNPNEWKIVVKELSRDDEGEYTCSATNVHGHDTHTFNLLVLEPPSLPRALHVSKKGSRTIKLSWSAPENGNSPITKYTLRYSKQSGGSPSSTKPLEKTISGDVSSVTVDSLTPASTYIFTLYAHNALGASRPSESLEVHTDGEVPGGSPTLVTSKALSSSSIRVSWQAPPVSLHHGNIIAYTIKYREKMLPDTSPFQSSSVVVNSLNTIQCCQHTIRGLTPYTEYTVITQAVNSQGPGPESEAVGVTTLEDVPIAAPSNLRCSSLNSKSLAVSWDALSDSEARGRVIGYKILYRSEPLENLPKKEVTSSLQVSLQNLYPFTNYSIQVLAYTRMGEGVISAGIGCTTMEDVPGEVTSIKAVWESSESVVVSWLPPALPNGLITAYTLKKKSNYQSTRDKRTELKDSVTQHRLLLKNDREIIHVSVSAVNRVGEGPPSKALTIKRPYRANAEISAGILSWGEKFSVFWREDISLRCETVGKPSPTVIWSKQNQPLNKNNERVTWYTDGTLVLRDAQRTDSGNYTCTAMNPSGKDFITYNLHVQVPPSPPIVNAVPKSSSSLLVTWTTTPDSGAPILSLTISYKRDYGEWKEVQIPATKSDYLLRHLSCGTKYQIFITAHNRVGSSRPSQMVTTSTEGGDPEYISSPLTDDVIYTNTSWAVVSIRGWNDNGCSITHYSVAYKRNQKHQNWLIASDHVIENSRVELNGLWPNTKYVTRVTAHSVSGSTIQDFPFATTSLSEDVIGAPRQVLEGNIDSRYISDIRVLLPLVASALVLVAVLIFVSILFRKKWWHFGSNTRNHDTSHGNDVRGSDKEREHLQLYTTIRKGSSPHIQSQSDSAPEYAEDIYPYATFQMNTLHQQRLQKQRAEQLNHQHAQNELKKINKQHHKLDPQTKLHLQQQTNHPAYQGAPYEKENYQLKSRDASMFQPYLYGEMQIPPNSHIPNHQNSNGGKLIPPSIEGRARLATPRPLISESEDYEDSYASDSETDRQSRTESSTQDYGRIGVSAVNAGHHNLIYLASGSSACSEASPTLSKRSHHTQPTRRGITSRHKRSLHANKHTRQLDIPL